ncbi:MAG: NADH-quinone oxidoreductase subunit A [Candidatus Micrarchaeia archaeon]
MPYNYIAIAIFSAIAIALPFLIILIAKLIGEPEERNPVKNSNYESAEASIGEKSSLAMEYMHYFPLFLGFELIAAIVIVWVAVARSISFNYDMFVLLLAVLSAVFVMFGMALAHKVDTYEY